MEAFSELPAAGLPAFDFASYVSGVWDLRRVTGDQQAVVVERTNFTVVPAIGVPGAGEGTTWLARAPVTRLSLTGSHYEVHPSAYWRMRFASNSSGTLQELAVAEEPAASLISEEAAADPVAVASAVYATAVSPKWRDLCTFDFRAAAADLAVSVTPSCSWTAMTLTGKEGGSALGSASAPPPRRTWLLTVHGAVQGEVEVQEGAAGSGSSGFTSYAVRRLTKDERPWWSQYSQYGVIALLLLVNIFIKQKMKGARRVTAADAARKAGVPLTAGPADKKDK